MKTLKFGVATRDITPPVGLILSGYTPRTSRSIDHPLRAEALVCDSGSAVWALLTVDVLAFALPFVEAIRKDIAARTGLKPEAIMLTAVHTHSGPNSFAAEWQEAPEEVAYFRAFRQALIEVAVAAWEQRAPGELVHARTRAPDLASNRRVQTPTGEWTNDWADPEGRHTGYFDSTVELVGVRRPDGRLDALLVTYGCHPVCFGFDSTAISGDYVSYLKDALEASGQVATALFAVSGHGNVDPRVCVQNDPAAVRAMGKTLADIVLTAIPALTPVLGDRAGFASVPWSMSTTWELNAHFAAFFRHGRKGDTVRTEINALGVGDLAFIGLPGETLGEYMAKLRATSPFAKTLLLSLANDFIGYLPTDEVLREGAYEAGLCPARPIEEPLMTHAGAALKRLVESMC